VRKPPFTATLALALSACAGLLPQPDEPQLDLQARAQAPGLPAPTPLNYRQLTADAAAGLLKDIPLTGAQISELRAPQATQLGDWVACLKTDGRNGGSFAVFYEDGKVFDIRRAVAVDRCEQAAYASLPQPHQPKPDTGDGTDVAPKQPAKRPGKPPRQ
jgi:hypothetical protein